MPSTDPRPAYTDAFDPKREGGWGTTDAGWAWTDVSNGSGRDFAPPAGTTLKMRLDNSAGMFTPGRKVRVFVGDVDYGVFTVTSWEHGLRLINEKRQRLVRCSRLHAAYRRRRAWP